LFRKGGGRKKENGRPTQSFNLLLQFTRCVPNYEVEKEGKGKSQEKAPPPKNEKRRIRTSRFLFSTGEKGESSIFLSHRKKGKGKEKKKSFGFFANTAPHTKIRKGKGRRKGDDHLSDRGKKRVLA